MIVPDSERVRSLVVVAMCVFLVTTPVGAVAATESGTKRTSNAVTAGSTITSIKSQMGIAGSSSSASVERMVLTDNGDGTFRPGEQLTISPKVINDGDVTTEIRARITVDGDTQVRGPLTVDPGATQWYGRLFTPSTAGEYKITVQVEVKDGSSWRTTDTATQTVSVTADTGDNTTDGATGGTTANNTQDSTKSESGTHSVYVWGYAWTLVGDDAAASRFFETAKEEEIDTVYLAAGVARSASDAELAQFIRTAHSHGLDVEALVGARGIEGLSTAERTTADVVSYNTGRDTSAQFDGIHLDVEPAGADLAQFLPEYSSLLDRLPQVSGGGETVAAQNLTVSASVGPYWSYNHPTLSRQVVDHPTIDSVSVMAYGETEKSVRDQIDSIMSGTDTPYRLAIETQEFTRPVQYTTTSHYERGPDSVKRLRQAIASDPPVAGYTGSALHYYSSSISTWHALRDATLSKDQIQAGESISVTASVLFDDNFAQSAHQSTVVVLVEGNDKTYRAKTTIEPPSGQEVTPTIQVSVPETAPAGTYTVTVLLRDTTYEGSNREATGTRNNPVEIGRLDAGTVSIEN